MPTPDFHEVPITTDRVHRVSFAVFRRCFLVILLAVAGLSAAGPASAVVVEGLYTGNAEVASRTSERERNEAFAVAMRQVLVKVTGRADVLQLAEVARALASPQSYVESFAYNSRPGPEGEVITLEVKFFQSQIQSLLDRNSIPVWPQNRPVTLVWVVEQDAGGNRRLATTDAPVFDMIRQQAQERGMPLLMPLMDIEDRRLIDIEQLWNLDSGHVNFISRRYNAESVLVIRVFTSLGNEFLGRSLFTFRGQELVDELYANNLQDLVVEPVNRIAEQLAAYYAVLISGNQSIVPVQMRVDGIENLRHYAALLEYVNSLADVSAVSIRSVKDTTITLDLQTGGQIRQLIEAIALDRNLQPVTEATRSGTQVTMHYQWRP